MAIFNSVSENIILPLSDLITGQSISKQLKFLQKSQFWTREQLDHYQNIKLKELINHAYKNVPFYTNLFNDLRIKPEDIQSKEDLKKLPIITKDVLKKNKSLWLAKNFNKKNLIFLSSSGSTGEPFQYYKTKYAESFQKAAAIRGWYWMGYRLGDRYVKTSIHERSSYIKKLQDRMNNSLFLSFTQFQPDFFEKIIRQITEYNPQIIRGYPFPLVFLSKQIIAQNGKYFSKDLKAINTTGSTLLDQDRNYIENTFNVKVFDSYSCEGGAFYIQCPTLSNYHPAEEYAISEFIKDDIYFSDPEKPFRHITTDLHNYACPFIRYDTQDYIVLNNSEENCNCGRNYINIKKIKGRDTDILITSKGKYVLMENILGYFEDKHQVDQVQVIQEHLKRFIFNLIVNDEFNDKVYKEIYSFWQDFIGHESEVVINLVSEIKLTPTGKRRTVIRNPEIKLNG